MGAFLALFFFEYATVVEGTIVRDAAHDISSSITSTLKEFPQGKKFINALNTPKKITKGKPPHTSSDVQDKHTYDRNVVLKHMWWTTYAIPALAGAVGLLLVSVVLDKWKPTLWWVAPFSMSTKDARSIVIKVLVGLLFVAWTEFLFLRIVASKYRAVDPNYVRHTVLKALLNWTSSKRNEPHTGTS